MTRGFNSTLTYLYVKDFALIHLQCHYTDQSKACDACDYCDTALPCFGFRLEHLVDQMFDCEKCTTTRIHESLVLTIVMEVSVTFHGFCSGKSEMLRNISLSGSPTAMTILGL